MIFKIQLVEINSLGKLQFPRRVYNRLKRYFRRLKTFLYTHILYHRESKPWYKKLLDILQSLGLTSTSKKVYDEDVINTEQNIPYEDNESEDGHSKISNESKSLKVGPGVQKYITKGVLAGLKYQWNYDPSTSQGYDLSPTNNNKGNLRENYDRYVNSIGFNFTFVNYDYNNNTV